MEGNRKLKKLVRKAMQGSTDAFEQLVKDFSPTVLYLAGLELDNKSEVEDVAQEAVLVLYRNIAKLKSPYAFYSYLRQTVHYISMERNRKQARIKSEDFDEYIEKSSKRLPEKLVEYDEITLREREDNTVDAAKMASLLERLPDRQRESLYLHYYQEFSYKEIAKLQGISINTVGVNISKAKESLRKIMKHD